MNTVVLIEKSDVPIALCNRHTFGTSGTPEKNADNARLHFFRKGNLPLLRFGKVAIKKPLKCGPKYRKAIQIAVVATGDGQHFGTHL